MFLSIIVGLLALAGVIAVLWKLGDSLRSVVQVLTSVLTPFFQPGTDQSLTTKFGPWAGKEKIFHTQI